MDNRDRPDGWDPSIGERRSGIPLSSGRFWAAFLGYLGCFAVPLFLQNNGLLVGVFTVGLLVAGIAAALLLRNEDRTAATGVGCGVLVAVVVIGGLGLFFVLWINFGTLP